MIMSELCGAVEAAKRSGRPAAGPTGDSSSSVLPAVSIENSAQVMPPITANAANMREDAADAIMAAG